MEVVLMIYDISVAVCFRCLSIEKPNESSSSNSRVSKMLRYKHIYSCIRLHLVLLETISDMYRKYGNHKTRSILILPIRHQHLYHRHPFACIPWILYDRSSESPFSMTQHVTNSVGRQSTANWISLCRLSGYKTITETVDAQFLRAHISSLDAFCSTLFMFMWVCVCVVAL